MTTIVVNVMCVLGALIILMSSIAMLRGGDALIRISALSPATGLGLPLIVLAAWIHTEATRSFSLDALIRLIVTIMSLLIVSSIGSNVLTRAAFLSGAPLASDTEPDDLAPLPDNDDEPAPNEDGAG